MLDKTGEGSWLPPARHHSIKESLQTIQKKLPSDKELSKDRQKGELRPSRWRNELQHWQSGWSMARRNRQNNGQS